MSKLYSALRALVAVILPVFLLMTAIRLVMNPVYPQIEYHMPGFPADPYGFSLQDRLHWSRYAIDYLLNGAGISFLGNLTFPDGSQLFNQRELSHMLDVKVLVQHMITWWWILLGALIVLAIWAWRGKWLNKFLLGLSTGGWIAVGLVAAILMGVATNFSGLFTAFHELFFTGSSWLFYYSDTLIRLFPMRFWSDAFILVGGFTLVVGALFGYFGRKLSYRAQPEELR